MVAMRAVGNGHRMPLHAHVHEEADRYLIRLDLPEFKEDELEIELLGLRLTVRAEQVQTVEDERQPFRLQERFEESFRLPDDADADRVSVRFQRGTLEIRAARSTLEPRLLPIEHPAHLIHADAEAC